jgi:hypothetical protein
MPPKTGSLVESIVGDLQAVLLLAGKVRPSPLTSRIGRSLLDLPLDADRTLLDLWCEQAAVLARTLALETVSVRVVVDQAGHIPSPSPARPCERVVLRTERDPNEYRGTAGLIKDLAAAYPADGWVLVGSALQLPLVPLHEIVGRLADAHAGISMLAQDDGRLAGMMLVRVASLGAIPSVGFVDFKEQALPAIAKEHSIRVVRGGEPAGLPIHTRGDYVDVLRRHHQGADAAVQEDPFAERWQAVFSLVEDGARVAPSARLLDSVVLRGGVVEEDAVLVRTVVCPGGVVRRGQRVVEELVSVEAN